MRVNESKRTKSKVLVVEGALSLQDIIRCHLEKDGYEVLKEISENKFDVKVVVLTAYADVKSAIDSARLGASDFISKPYDLDELLITIRKVLQRDD